MTRQSNKPEITGPNLHEFFNAVDAEEKYTKGKKKKRKKKKSKDGKK